MKMSSLLLFVPETLASFSSLLPFPWLICSLHAVIFVSRRYSFIVGVQSHEALHLCAKRRKAKQSRSDLWLSEYIPVCHLGTNIELSVRSHK